MDHTGSAQLSGATGKKEGRGGGCGVRRGALSYRTISSTNHEAYTVLSNTQVLMFMF